MAEISIPRWRGLAIAAGLYLAWLGHMLFWLHADLAVVPLPWVLLALFLQSWLYAGLFITAHDAMHGAIVPDTPRLNFWVGQIAVFSYALFSFKKLLQRHGRHHSHPASADDPDFHDGVHTGPLRWYLHFMLHYLSPVQLAGMALIFNLLQHAAGVALPNILLFWVVPALLSTGQLFYFGTYLPHRMPAGGYDNMHRATTSSYPVWLSLLTCFHFGYHLEHHVYPTVPWWRLPHYHRREGDWL
jgi:beta-carotene/zeaxanthin 4-ketolase